ncbi:hypothetical protein ABIF07_005457 [Bradyrhizobium elkanii]
MLRPVSQPTGISVITPTTEVTVDRLILRCRNTYSFPIRVRSSAMRPKLGRQLAHVLEARRAGLDGACVQMRKLLRGDPNRLIGHPRRSHFRPHLAHGARHETKRGATSSIPNYGVSIAALAQLELQLTITPLVSIGGKQIEGRFHYRFGTRFSALVTAYEIEDGKSNEEGAHQIDRGLIGFHPEFLQYIC